MPIVSRSTHSILLASEAARTEVQPLLTIGTLPGVSSWAGLARLAPDFRGSLTDLLDERLIFD
jgi:hypothetical protein